MKGSLGNVFQFLVGGEDDSLKLRAFELFGELQSVPSRDAPQLEKLFKLFGDDQSLPQDASLRFINLLFDFLNTRDKARYPAQRREEITKEWWEHFSSNGVILWSDFCSVVQLLANPEEVARAHKQLEYEAKVKAEIVEETRVSIDDGDDLVARSKSIPLRLSDKERTLLQILEGALTTSDYTDRVDVLRTRQYRKDTQKNELKEIFSIIHGIFVVHDIKEARKLKDNFSDNEKFFSSVFEIGRRNKILNPDKMRSTYGKLMFMLTDAVGMDLQPKKGVLCVYKYLSDLNATELLSDPDIIPATKCFITSFRSEMEQARIEKKAARANLLQKYSSPSFPREEVVRVLDSLSDSNAYILSNRHPVDRMLKFLKKYFNPSKPDNSELSLAIGKGKGGSCLSHSHSTQYQFVYQSLMLWREIMHEMYKLWIAADADLILESYSLSNTGQGLNRVQSAPRVSQLMSKILSRVKSQVGSSWVGLSVVHLGDRDVPNALFFIDKYNQVSRILAPIVHTLDQLHALLANPKDKNTRGVLQMINGLYAGSFSQPSEDPEGTRSAILYLKKKILCDFFKHGFDGSGDDGGSCIDGRLTSAWNWCSKIEKKDYYPFFLLTGFSGFDGSFRK